jgi:hypothetical protein
LLATHTIAHLFLLAVALVFANHTLFTATVPLVLSFI